MSQDPVAEARSELRAAFDDLIGELQSAREAIDDPAYFGPPATERVLAEGYRYLAGFMHHGIERAFNEDADFPAFRNALSIFNKSTIDNSDAIYFYSPIDGRRTYRITGRAEDFREPDQPERCGLVSEMLTHAVEIEQLRHTCQAEHGYQQDSDDPGKHVHKRGR